MQYGPGQDPESDEFSREDGFERYWLFYKGEWAETILGLVAVSQEFSGVFYIF
jgi:hypothetical protein